MSEKVILMPSYEQALNYRKYLARKSPKEAFDVTVTTPQAWLEDAWDRYGDGTHLVSSLDRAFAVQHVLNQQDNPVLPATSGVISLLCRFFNECVGSSELEQALDQLAQGTLEDIFSSNEREILMMVSRYREVLSQCGLIEQGDALSALARLSMEGMLPFDMRVGATFEMPVLFERFLCTVGLSPAQSKVVITRLEKGVQPHFLLAAGPSAENALILQHLHDSLSFCKRILVITHRSFELFGFVSRSLPEQGVRVCLSSMRPFLTTAFGRTFSALVSFLLDTHHDWRSLADFLDSPFAGIDALRSSQADGVMRGDRLLTFEDLIAMTRLLSPHFDTFEDLIQESDASVLLDYIEDAAGSLSGKNPAYTAEQVSAVAALRRVYETARFWQVSPEGFTFALESLSVDASREVMPSSKRADSSQATLHIGSLPCELQSNERDVSGERQVVIASRAHASRFMTQQWDEIILCDLDDSKYSASERHDALVTLQQKLGFDVHHSRLESQRKWFESLKKHATQRFTCERSLDSGEDAEMYPAFLWDEFVDAYRTHASGAGSDQDTVHAQGEVDSFVSEANDTDEVLSADEELDEYGMPYSLRGKVSVRGEEQFAANVEASVSLPQPLTLEPIPQDSGVNGVSSSLHEALLLKRDQNHPMVLSPSAIETYINCPYSWFVTNRLRPQSPDEELGPLEQGTFVHAVLDEFYAQLRSCNHAARVLPDNLDQSRELLSDVFDKVLSEQHELESTRYVPITPSEWAQAHKLKETLLRNIAVQAYSMQAFVPEYRELDISPEEEIEYAGVVIRGRVDRVDVNPTTSQFVVVDYKGSIAGHDAGYDPDKQDASSDPDKQDASDTAFPLPHKVQALIYAQVCAKKLGLRPVGALYMSYKAQEHRGLLAGSYAEGILDINRFTTKKSSVNMNFETYLLWIEQAIASRLEEMKAGVIDKRPLCADSCRYCPVVGCKGRLS